MTFCSPCLELCTSKMHMLEELWRCGETEEVRELAHWAMTRLVELEERVEAIDRLCEKIEETKWKMIPEGYAYYRRWTARYLILEDDELRQLCLAFGAEVPQCLIEAEAKDRAEREKAMERARERREQKFIGEGI